MSNNETKKLEAKWKRVCAAHAADMPALTVTLARKLLDEWPDCGPAWQVLGTALIDMARYDEAAKALEQATKLCPSDKLWLPLCAMGHLRKTEGDYSAAADWYQAAIDLNPEEASGYIYMGGVLAKDGKLKEAEAAHLKATQCPQGCRDEAFLNLGLVLRAQERYAEAIHCFEQALELDPKYEAAMKALRDVRGAMRAQAS